MYVNVQHKNVNLLTKKSQCLTGIERFFGINNCKTPEERYTRFDHPLLIGNFLRDNKDKLSLNDEQLERIIKMDALSLIHI